MSKEQAMIQTYCFLSWSSVEVRSWMTSAKGVVFVSARWIYPPGLNLARVCPPRYTLLRRLAFSAAPVCNYTCASASQERCKSMFDCIILSLRHKPRGELLGMLHFKKTWDKPHEQLTWHLNVRGNRGRQQYFCFRFLLYSFMDLGML